MASILSILENVAKSYPPLILLTFPWWHLLRKHNTNERHPFGCLFRFAYEDEVCATRPPRLCVRARRKRSVWDMKFKKSLDNFAWENI